MGDGFAANLNEITNKPELRKEFNAATASWVNAVGANLDLKISPETATLINDGDNHRNPNMNLAEYESKLQDSVNEYNKFNALETYNIGDVSGIQLIFDKIINYVNSYEILKTNTYGSDNRQDEKQIFHLYYTNIKKLKDLRDDLSNNIDTTCNLFKKLEFYTNTSPNLHLLSKTKDKLQNKIDSYEKHMNVDSKLNKELEINIKNNKNYNYYLLIIYYVILILFFIFSNFMKNKYYKNPVATVMIILYIIAPFIIKYILLYIYKFYLYIMKKFNLLNTGLTYEDIIKYDSYNYENNQENISYV